jgi:FixJ family two-component response regulator
MPLVAVVEDDPASQKTLARMLRVGGYQAALYASAEEFLASPPKSTPIGLLLDVHLSGMTGLELQRRLKDGGSTIPVIIITARADQYDKAALAGATALMEKPLHIPILLRTIQRLLDEPLERRFERIVAHETMMLPAID